MQDTKKLTAADLLQFTGSEQWYRHGIVRDVLFTDGAKYLADQAGAYWLLDEIALVQRYEKTVAGEEFQLWKLKVNFRPHRDAHLRGRERQDGLQQDDRIHRFSVAGDRAVFHEQDHSVAERVLRGRGRQSEAPLPLRGSQTNRRS